MWQPDTSANQRQVSPGAQTGAIISVTHMRICNGWRIRQSPECFRWKRRQSPVSACRDAVHCCWTEILNEYGVKYQSDQINGITAWSVTCFFVCVSGETEELELNVELIVQCIRSSSNPQTHHHALLLLTQAARLQPVSRESTTSEERISRVIDWLVCNVLFDTFSLRITVVSEWRTPETKEQELGLNTWSKTLIVLLSQGSTILTSKACLCVQTGSCCYLWCISENYCLEMI